MKICEINSCCGCLACMMACENSAIIASENEMGFIEPQIIEEKCLHCGTCVAVCPQNKVNSHSNALQGIYAVKAQSNILRKHSQSGGAFSVFAEMFLKQGGIVYGVALMENYDAKYTRVTQKCELKKLRGSKYVQANINSIFLQVKKDLTGGRKVLFSGTACHIGGLLNFLSENKTSRGNLVTVDLVCHGVPSPKVFKDFILWQSELRNGHKIRNFNFRDKKYGWHNHKESYVVKGNRVVADDYVNIFYSNYTLRSCCYDCKYSGFNHPGDITIGDCWGIEKIHPEFDDNKGVSLVLINTVNGSAMFNLVRDKFFLIEMTKENVAQVNLQHPTEKPTDTEQFWRDYQDFGPEYSFYRYCNISENKSHKCSLLYRCVKKLPSRLTTIIKHILI